MTKWDKTGTAREQIERETQRAHSGFETSDPPPASMRPGFSAALQHFSYAIGKASKRIAFMMAVWGTVSTTVGTAMVYWTGRQGFVREDRMAKLESQGNRIELSTQRIELTVSNWAPRITTLEVESKMHGETLATLRPREGRR